MSTDLTPPLMVEYKITTVESVRADERARIEAELKDYFSPGRNVKHTVQADVLDIVRGEA